MSSVSARTVFKFCMIPWVYKTLFSIIVYTPTEIQLDQTVIFFSEHSMKLYAVVDREKKKFLLFYCITLNTFYLASSTASLCCCFSSYKMKSKCHVFCRSHYFVNFWTSKVKESITQQHLYLSYLLFSFFSSLGVMPSQKRTKKTPFFSNT